MTAAGSSYKGFRFPPEIISHGVWLYHRFPLSFRDVQELMLERGVDVSYETIDQRSSCTPRRLAPPRWCGCAPTRCWCRRGTGQGFSPATGSLCAIMVCLRRK